MIFVTVGTHEQPFNRLIEEVDRLVETGVIEDEVFIQTGYSTYEPKFCKWSNLISFDEMNKLMRTSDIIITHGGPATFMSAVSNGKRTIVVPRQEKYGEHVNGHQVDFSRKVNDKYHLFYLLEDVNNLQKILCKINSEESFNKLKSNNGVFCRRLVEEINKILD